ncbi:Hypothetical_protein [Hexamita inflata]|uniref:Hypothetical_protein n=1 Tax=Hexamita inflata TaxID=28002 RepID=A0AA86NAU0_9EUKA|nr:Hypothetical protein HINF_LOCUS3643 [Hexamita inflata]CAI9939692.1 Hypothetical protein HINF_LOCUS27337 [Hexamita inflata]
MVHASNQTSSVVQLSANHVYVSHSFSNISFSHYAPGFKPFPCLSTPHVHTLCNQTFVIILKTVLFKQRIQSSNKFCLKVVFSLIIDFSFFQNRESRNVSKILCLVRITKIKRELDMWPK